MERVALIMAGGKGTRLWPLSTKEKPKQFISITSDHKTLLQKTVERISKIVPLANIFIVSNESYKKYIIEDIPLLPEENILIESCGRNTAPAILFSSFLIRKRLESDYTMMVFPSDHMIETEAQFKTTLEVACRVAEEGERIVTIGVVPSYPENNFGYIHYGSCLDPSEGVYQVTEFKEKPAKDLAEQYLKDGGYYWNSGIFIWKCSVFCSEFLKYERQLYSEMEDIVSRPDKNSYDSLKAISIDYALLEKSDKVVSVPAEFAWDDVGSFEAFFRHNPKDRNGNVVISSKNPPDISSYRNCIIIADDLSDIACENENMIIVRSGNHILTRKREIY